MTLLGDMRAKHVPVPLGTSAHRVPAGALMLGEMQAKHVPVPLGTGATHRVPVGAHRIPTAGALKARSCSAVRVLYRGSRLVGAVLCKVRLKRPACAASALRKQAVATEDELCEQELQQSGYESHSPVCKLEPDHVSLGE